MGDRKTSIAKELLPFVWAELEANFAAGPGDALLRDGSRSLLGNLLAADGVTIDGVDLSMHAGNAAAHHAPVTAGNTGISIAGQAVSLNLAANPGLQISSGLKLAFSGVPGAIQPDDAASAGASAYAARTDHRHAIATAAPVTLGVTSIANDEGIATSFARSDHEHQVDSSANPGGAASLLASGASGELQLVMLGLGAAPINPNSLHLVTGGRIDVASGPALYFFGSGDPGGARAYLNGLLELGGALSFTVAGSITTTGATSITISPRTTLQFDAGSDLVNLMASNTLATANWVSGDLGSGWGVTYAGAGDFRDLFAESLTVRAFIADIAQALAGSQTITKSLGILREDLTIPDTTSGPVTMNGITFEDLPGFAGVPIFVDGDWLRLRVINRSNGLSVGDVWARASGTATDNSDGTQDWSLYFDNDNGFAGSKVYDGSVILDYGQTGSGWWEATTLDSAGAPYAEVVTWVTDPSVPGNRTTHARTGNLTGLGFTNHWGLYAGIDTITQYILATDQALEAHGLDISLYQTGTRTIHLDAGTPALSIGNPTPGGYGSGAGIWMGNAGGVYRFRVGDPAGERLEWDGGSLFLRGSTNSYIRLDGTNGIQFYSGAGIYRGQITTSGSFWFGSAANDERIAWDATNGLQIFNSSNTAVFKFPTSGDAKVIGTLAVSNPGEISFAGGKGVLNSSGLEFHQDGTTVGWAKWYDTYDDAQEYKAGEIQGGIGTGLLGGAGFFYFRSFSQNTNAASSIELRAYRGPSTSGTYKAFTVLSDSSSTPGGFWFQSNSGTLMSLEASLLDIYPATQHHANTTFTYPLNNPNVVTMNYVNFGGTTQGGILSVNSAFSSWPNWVKTSTAASNNAMFVVLGAEKFAVTFGPAASSNGADPSGGNFSFEVTDHLASAYRLLLNQGGNDDAILIFRANEVAHPFTTYGSGDTYASFHKRYAGSGGLLLRTFSEVSDPLWLVGYAQTSDSTTGASAYGTITTQSSYTNGSNADTFVPSGSNIFVMRNYTSARVIVKGNGDFYVWAGNYYSFDDYDDLQLAEALDLELAPDQVIRDQFNEFLQYDRQTLLDAKLISDDGLLVNYAQLGRLHNGALRQMARRLQVADQRIADLERKLALLEV